MKVFATYNVKGGVGKTAATVNLAYLASRAGYRCVIWDLDPQGAAGFYFRIEPTATTDPQAFLEKKRGLKILSLNMGDMVRRLENAITFGDPVLLQVSSNH
jgi:cellulose biosynthesis protein BcsQ